jgi:hypothetical protein
VPLLDVRAEDQGQVVASITCDMPTPRDSTHPRWCQTCDRIPRGCTARSAPWRPRPNGVRQGRSPVYSVIRVRAQRP